MMSFHGFVSANWSLEFIPRARPSLLWRALFNLNLGSGLNFLGFKRLSPSFYYVKHSGFVSFAGQFLIAPFVVCEIMTLLPLFFLFTLRIEIMNNVSDSSQHFL